MKYSSYVVTLMRPEDVSDAEMKEYIWNAVGTWKGSYNPDDPLFDLDGDTVSVKQYRKPRK